MAFALSYQRGKDESLLALILTEYQVYDLLFRIFHHFLTRKITVGCSGTGVEQAQVVINLCCCAYSGPRVFVGGLLLDAYHRAEACDFVNVRTLHVAKKIAGVC